MRQKMKNDNRVPYVKTVCIYPSIFILHWFHVTTYTDIIFSVLQINIDWNKNSHIGYQNKNRYNV